MRSRKRRAKAMKIAAVADGVSVGLLYFNYYVSCLFYFLCSDYHDEICVILIDSVAFNEENRDQIVVIGNGVNSVGLTTWPSL